MIYLLDTDTLIHWMTGNREISKRILSMGLHNIASSDISKAERYYGAYRSKRVSENLHAIRNLSEKINFIPFNDPAQAIFGKIKSDMEKSGQGINDFDIMIASTALAYNLTLITTNTVFMEKIPALKITSFI